MATGADVTSAPPAVDGALGARSHSPRVDHASWTGTLVRTATKFQTLTGHGYPDVVRPVSDGDYDEASGARFSGRPSGKSARGSSR
jgi:hypothetical protein